ncbi:MAG: hypothetical protein GXN96_03920 [Aquificae bacterium]|nr:hypothetical protein [Aquificota bacterium]
MREFYLLLFFVLFLVGGVWLYNFLKERREEELKALSYKVYLYEKGELSEEEALRELKGTPFYPYVLSFTERYEEVYASLPAGELKKFYLERKEARRYEKGEFGGIEENLKPITKEDFNYPSALLLKGFLYEKTGRKDRSLGVWATLKSEYPGTYFGKVGELKLKIEGVE